MSEYESRRHRYWEGPSRWVNAVLLTIVGFIGLDTLFRLLGANEGNVIVGFVRAVASIFLAPFQDMFPAQEYLLTALIAVLGWSLLAAIVLAVFRALSTDDDGDGPERERRRREHLADGPADRDPTRRL
jgi:hypothetical protein